MQRILRVCDLASIDYRTALDLQTAVHAARVGSLSPDTLLLLEHSHVFTFGRNADESHLLESETALRQSGIDIERTGRGGDVTYHGPGQLVGYPIVSLKDARIGAGDFVSILEDCIISILAKHGITGARDDRNRGVWIGNSKIAAIGLRISRQVSMHGFALNVSTDLNYYQKIIPCGIAGAGVTSMQALGAETAMETLKKDFETEFTSRMHYDRVEHIESSALA